MTHIDRNEDAYEDADVSSGTTVGRPAVWIPTRESAVRQLAVPGALVCVIVAFASQSWAIGIGLFVVFLLVLALAAIGPARLLAPVRRRERGTRQR